MTERIITVREAINMGMEAAMQADENVFLLGEEVAEYNGAYKVSQGLLDKFGSKRVIDTPISEHGFAGMAVGAAFMGLRPIVEFMTFNFAMQAIDQIVNSAAKTLYMSGGQINCPIVFRGPNGVASRVGAQHSQCYASWYSHCPGLKVIAPYHADDCFVLIQEAIKDNNPVVFLENEIMYGHTFKHNPMHQAKIGQAEVVHQGTDVTLVSFSIGMHYCHQATEILRDKYNISVELIDLKTLRPLDMPTIIESVKKTNNLIIVQEGWPFASIGSEIACAVQEQVFDYLDSEITRISGKDVPLPYAQNLEKAALPNVEEIVLSAIKKIKN